MDDATQRPREAGGAPANAPARRGLGAPFIVPQQACPTCGVVPAADVADTAPDPDYVYAIGQIEVRFPSLDLEKEYAQAGRSVRTARMTDQQAMHAVLTDASNRYLARQMCYVLTIEGIDTYLLYPRDPVDVDLLRGAIRPTPTADDVDVVIGVRGPIAPPEACNGLMVPIVVFDQIYSFDTTALVAAIPRPESMSADDFGPAAQELFRRIVQMADNAGATDEHRALNYLAVRYDTIYAHTTQEFAQDSSLTAVEVRPSRLSGLRNIVDVIFSYTNRTTDVTERFFVRVDVTGEFPFLITPLQAFFER
jgi:hypothetical protein